MENTPFELLLEHADQAASQGDWQITFDDLAQASQLDPAHAGVASGQGTCLIQMGRAEEAVPYFQQAARLAPDSPDAHNNLAVALMLAGRLPEAESACQEATRQDPNHTQAWKNLALICLQQDRMVEGVQILAALVSTQPQDVESKILLAKCYEEGGENESARYLYQQALRIEPGNTEAQAGVSRLPQPATDPTRIARPEHAQKLAALKGLTRKGEAAPQAAGKNGARSQPSSPSIAFYGPALPATEIRLGPVIHTLQQNGTVLKVSTRFDPQEAGRYDTFVVARPHSSPELLEAARWGSQAGKRVILDLDEDLPENSPALAALGQVDVLVAASPVLGERYGKFARRVEVIPNGWDRSNPLWDKPAPRRTTIHIGLVGNHTSPEQAEILKRLLAELVRAFPQALLSIGADYNLVQVFSSIPEERCLFIPAGRLEDYPFLLSNFDILLVPGRNEESSQARSDLPLLEAGIRRIPWIAPPVPSFMDWGAGGLFAGKTEDWYPAMKRLLEDAVLRRDLGEAGRLKAEERDARAITARWNSLF